MTICLYEVAIKNFADLYFTARDEVSIACLLQDPLSKLVKINVKLIWMEQYQHDKTDSNDGVT